MTSGSRHEPTSTMEFHVRVLNVAQLISSLTSITIVFWNETSVTPFKHQTLCMQLWFFLSLPEPFYWKNTCFFPKWPISELRWLATRNDFYISAACLIMNLNSLQIDYSTTKSNRFCSARSSHFVILSQWLTFWTFGDSIFSRENKVQTFFSGSIG